MLRVLSAFQGQLCRGMTKLKCEGTDCVWKVLSPPQQNRKQNPICGEQVPAEPLIMGVTFVFW